MKETVIPLFAFLEQVRKGPKQRPASDRRHDFASIYTPYSPRMAQKQGERCLDCGNPYCQWQCPVHNNIPQWLQLVAEGRVMEAADLAHQTNSLPEVCGQLCPQEILCEGACTLNAEFGAVSIGAIENYLTETALQQGWKPDLSQVIASGFRVAVIGAGPAGLACADRLSRLGVEVTVFDRHPEIGGLLTFGIPQFKLEKRIIQRRRALLEGMGIRFQLQTGIESNGQVNELLTQYDALFLALGADRGIDAAIPGEALPGVYQALPFLIREIRHTLGLDTKQPFDFKGKSIVVLGAGDTAMDCARTAVRLGAKTVTCVYRRSEGERRGVQKDYKHAREEGVQFLWNQQAVAFHGKQRVQGVRFAATECDAAGNCVLLETQTHIMPADAVLIAYGFSANPPAWFAEQGIRTRDNGLVMPDESTGFALQTSHPKIFAGGDMILGANLIVNAVAQGQSAAKAMWQYLRSGQGVVGRF